MDEVARYWSAEVSEAIPFLRNLNLANMSKLIFNHSYYKLHCERPELKKIVRRDDVHLIFLQCFEGFYEGAEHR